MRKYDGIVTYQSQDDDGIIEVVESEGIRALHFGSSSRQSSMVIKQPDNLHSLYARAMMAWLLFKEQPGHVLMIGLGGGTLTRYLLGNFADCKIKVIEYRRSVVKIARSHFELPRDARLKIIIGDGGQFIRQQSLTHSGRHDLIIVDAFNHDGMSDSVNSEAFFDGCKTLLKNDGILAINLWGTDKAHFKQVAWNLGRVFEWCVLFLPVRGRGNIIAFCFNAGCSKPTIKDLKARAQELEDQHQIEFPNFVQDFKRNNNSVLNRVIQT